MQIARGHGQDIGAVKQKTDDTEKYLKDLGKQLKGGVGISLLLCRIVPKPPQKE